MITDTDWLEALESEVLLSITEDENARLSVEVRSDRDHEARRPVKEEAA